MGIKAFRNFGNDSFCVKRLFFILLGCTARPKCSSLLATKADYQLTEEFSHMNLFSMTDDDSVIIIKSDESDSTAGKLNRGARQSGL